MYQRRQRYHLLCLVPQIQLFNYHFPHVTRPSRSWFSCFTKQLFRKFWKFPEQYLPSCITKLECQNATLLNQVSTVDIFQVFFCSFQNIYFQKLTFLYTYGRFNNKNHLKLTNLNVYW